MLSCQNLIEKFQKVGGKLTCHYDDKRCTLQADKKIYCSNYCKITPDDNTAIDMLINDFAYVYDDYFTELPIKDNQISPLKLHHYQKDNISGFIVKLDIDKYGYYCKYEERNEFIEDFYKK